MRILNKLRTAYCRWLEQNRTFRAVILNADDYQEFMDEVTGREWEKDCHNDPKPHFKTYPVYKKGEVLEL